MALWIAVIISSYICLAFVAIGDKYLLTGRLKPKIFSFYVGVSGILSLVLIPFVGFVLPDSRSLFLALSAGILFLIGVLFLYKGMEKFEASRIVPAIGGLLPIFTFFLVWFFSHGEAAFSASTLLSFILLLAGSVLVTLESKKVFSFSSLKIAAIAAFLFALSFLLTKKVYLAMPFWSGFIWIRIGSFIIALTLLLSKEVRQELLASRSISKQKTGVAFLIVQGLGAFAAILQNWAIALAGIVFLPIINALQGVQYAFLFILAILFSKKAPHIFKEKISSRVFFQKGLALLLIVAGLLFLEGVF